MPLENSLSGSIHENYDLLRDYDLRIIGEVTIRIMQNLLAKPGTELSDIRRVLSHPQGIEQCRQFLSQHQWELVAVSDTAGAAERVSVSQDAGEAAIAGLITAEIYGLSVIAEGIETNPRNYTRFVVVGREPIEKRTASKTSLILSAKNEPGALFSILQVFAEQKINMIKLESRPIPGEPWRYMFYIDIETDLESEALSRGAGGTGGEERIFQGSRLLLRMTRHLVAAADVLQERLFLSADALACEAAGVKAAAGRRVDGARHVPRKQDFLAAGVRIGKGNRRQQRLAVWMTWVCVQLLGTRHLHDAAEIHHRHAIADVLHHTQIVANEEIGKIHLLLELGQQVDHLGLDGHIQGRDRFVADDGQGIQGQGPGDADALALASGKFMGVPAHVCRMEPHAVHEEDHPVLNLIPGQVQVVADRLGDDIAHVHARVQGGERVLENDLQRRPGLAHLPAVERRGGSAR